MKSNPKNQLNKILITTASVGSGHNSAANALAKQLAISAPDIEVKIADAMDFTSKPFRMWYAGGFNLAMSTFPKAYALGYFLTSNPIGPKKMFAENRRSPIEAMVLKKYGKFVREYQPDLVLHTHFLAPLYIAKLCNKQLLAAKQEVVITDIIPHRWWTAKNVEQYYVSQQASKDELIRWGVNEDRVSVTGIPIHPKWIAKQESRKEICERWGLPADKKIVLISGGVEFTCGPILKIAQNIAKQNADACVVVLGGRNKVLIGKLATLTEAKTKQVVPIGYTDKLPELAEVADLMITKPGGLTTAECLSKSLPMIFIKPVYGQEGNNAKFITKHQGGLIAKSANQTVKLATEVLKNSDKLEQMSQSAGKLYKPGCQTIVQQILERYNYSEK